MPLKAAEFPVALKKAIRALIHEANKVGWLVWVPQQDEPSIDGFVCGNERFLKRVGIGLARSGVPEPAPPPDRTH